MDLIGPKVERFYLALSQQVANPEQQIEDIVNSMRAIENHEPVTQALESDEVIAEMVRDCQKKCAQVLRAPFADSIRNVIAATRKRLATKAALDSEASYQHNQRHLNLLIEILGTWSNIVAQTCEFGFSRSLTRQILSPLYTRILEAALECFVTFKRDKELEQWGTRLLNENTEYNVASLDSLVSQVAAFRSMVHQHYSYLYSCFHPSKTGSDRFEPPLNSTAGVNNSAVLENMLIVSNEELLQWRELDAQYVTMEFGFLQRATQKALSERALIEVETGVYIPQCVEDVFFVLGKVCERALGTGSESNLFSVGNRVVELLRYTAPEEFDRHSVLFRVVCSKALYRRCVVRKEVSAAALKRILEGGVKRSAMARPASSGGFNTNSGGSNSAYHTPTKSSTVGSKSTPNSGSGRESPQSSGAFLYSTPGKALVDVVSQTALGSIFLGSTPTSSADPSNSASASTSTSASSLMPSSPALGALFSESTAASLNSWFSDQLSPYLSGDDGVADAGGAESGVAAPSTAGGAGIAMQGTPVGGGQTPPQSKGSSRAPLHPGTSATAGYSTPGTKPGPSGSSKPPTAASSKHTPPSSSSGKYGTAAITGNSGAAASGSTNTGMSMEEVLLQALVGDDDGSDTDDAMYYGASAAGPWQVSLADPAKCADGYEFGAFLDAQHRQLQLRAGDWVVQINALCTIAGSVGTLQGVVAKGRGLSRIYESDTTGRGSRGSPIDILLQVRTVLFTLLAHNISPLIVWLRLQELRACHATYTNVLDAEARQLARWTFLSQIQYPLHKFCVM
jgi:hypothetical protein